MNGMLRFFGYFFFSILLISCTDKNVQQEKPVARVFDQYLYKSDLEGVFPENISKSDSTVLANDYIDKWIRKQLLVRKAELNLTDDEKNVKKQIENYRSSVLIFKYEQNLINQKIDTVITDRELEEYYNANLTNFLLNNTVVKALFIQVPLKAPDIANVKRWYKSNNDEDIKKLDAYAFHYAVKYDYFDEDWVDIRQIENALPVKIDVSANSLKWRKNFEVSDSLYHYFVTIKDFCMAGSVAPLEYVEQNIRTIIMNKRKVQLIKKLESNIYNDALNRGYFTIY
jgi:hypothetical protein